jgi:hypothetical protein
MLKAVAVNRLLTMVVMGFLLLFYPEAETSPGKMLFQAATGAYAAWRMASMRLVPVMGGATPKRSYRAYQMVRFPTSRRMPKEFWV